MKITDITAEKKEKQIQRLAAYCRVSSDSEDQLHSFAAQVCYYSNYEKQHPEFELVGVYADEGLSGTSMKNRTELQRMITDCEKGKIDRVITKSVSRFARNTHDLLKTIRLLKELGVTVFFEEQGIDTAQLNSELFLTFPGMIAQQESESISGNMRWSYKKRMESGEFNCCNPAYGFDLVNGKLVVNEKEAAVIRRIFDMYLQGIGKERIADIKRIIEDKRYLGCEEYPSIIGEDLSASANSIKTSKNSRTKINKDNLIYRINAEVRCPCCGDIMKRIYEPRNKIPERWRCIKQGCHKIIPISDNDLLLEVQDIINTMISNPDLIIIPDSENTISSTTQCTINEINHMLNSRDAKSDDLRSKMLEAVSLKYRDLNTSTYESQRLKDLFRSLNPFTEFPIELFNQTVSIISFDNNENVTVTLINGQIIRKEDKNGTQKDSSCDSTYNCRQRGCQEQIQTEAGRSLLPSVHTAGRANQ